MYLGETIDFYVKGRLADGEAPPVMGYLAIRQQAEEQPTEAPQVQPDPRCVVDEFEIEKD